MALAADYAEAYDKLRTQLSQLSTSISLLKVDLERQDPLPSWPSLQSSTAALGSHLTAVNNALSGYKNLLSSAHAYPLPSFPGHVQEVLLQQLLRKKLDPRAEEWIEESSKAVTNTGGPQSNGTDESIAVAYSEADMQALWETVGGTTHRIVRRMARKGQLDDDYTTAERRNGVRNVDTGLKRKLGRRPVLEDEDEDEDEMEDDVGGSASEDENDDGAFDDEDEDEAADGVIDPDAIMTDAGTTHDAAVRVSQGIDPSRPVMPLNSLLKFISSGDLAKRTK